MSGLEACRRCDNPTADSASELCAGCENELRGRCRWCAVRPPGAGGDLCAECEDAAEIALERGGFAATSDVAAAATRIPPGRPR